METDEQDEESSQDQDLPSENDNSQSEDSVGGDNELENGVVGHQNSVKGTQTAGQRKRLFTFQFNNMGKTDLSLIKEDTRQIRFDEGHLRLSGELHGSVSTPPIPLFFFSKPHLKNPRDDIYLNNILVVGLAKKIELITAFVFN